MTISAASEARDWFFKLDNPSIACWAMEFNMGSGSQTVFHELWMASTNLGRAWPRQRETFRGPIFRLSRTHYIASLKRTWLPREVFGRHFRAQLSFQHDQIWPLHWHLWRLEGIYEVDNWFLWGNFLPRLGVFWVQLLFKPMLLMLKDLLLRGRKTKLDQLRES